MGRGKVVLLFSILVHISHAHDHEPDRYVKRRESGSSFSISPSISYQYHTNDNSYGDYDQDEKSPSQSHSDPANARDSMSYVYPSGSPPPPQESQVDYYSYHPNSRDGQPQGFAGYEPQGYDHPPGGYDSGYQYEPHGHEEMAKPPPHPPPPPPPPPPPAIKGSIDYVLIPLILLGVAGPIFVVMYVVLGAIEAKLSPIQRRSISDSFASLQPSKDFIFVSVAKALEKHECLERAACNLGSYFRTLGLTQTSLLERSSLFPL